MSHELDWKMEMHGYVLQNLFTEQRLVEANATPYFRRMQKENPELFQAVFGPRTNPKKPLGYTVEDIIEGRHKMEYGVLYISRLVTYGCYLGQIRKMFLDEQIGSYTLIEVETIEGPRRWYLHEMAEIKRGKGSDEYLLYCQGAVWRDQVYSITKESYHILSQFDLN